MSPFIYSPFFYIFSSHPRCLKSSWYVKVLLSHLFFFSLLSCGQASAPNALMEVSESIATDLLVSILSGHFLGLLGLTSQVHYILLTRYFLNLMVPVGGKGQVPRLTSWKGAYPALLNYYVCKE